MIGCTQVDVGFARLGIALDYRVEVKFCLGKGLYHLISHLEAILADAWPHGDLDAVGTRTQSAHLTNDGSGIAPHGAAPPGMDNGDDASLIINEDNGHTVGSVHPNDHTPQRCHQRVNAFKSRFLLVDIKRAESLVYDCHTAGVGLSRHHQIIKVETQLHR